MLLIQVQKTKVDLDLAMAALDKLLRANELNFGLLAILPSLALFFVLTRYTVVRIKGYSSASKSTNHSNIRHILR